jgi:His/Glu/Gln/Arg/opine family amino acid ABC transporter permease subunit
MDDLIRYAPLLARGALVTLALGLLSLVLATGLGILGAAAKLGAGPLLRGAAFAYTTLSRSVPELVLLLLAYFGGQRLINTVMDAAGGWPVSLSPFWAGVIVLGFIYGGYLTETFRGAYMTIPAGQVEAARALGMHSLALHRTVTLPQAVRFALPGYANVWQVLIKATAVVSVIGLNDMVGLADEAGKTTRAPFVFFAAVLGVYLFFTWVSTTIFERLENRFGLGASHAR